MDGQVLMHTEELITQNYSSSHKAIDLVGEGHSIDDVIAVSDGVVEIAVNTVTKNNTNARGTASYGNYVKIKHDDGTKSLYAHMQYGSVSVKTGDRVSKGQKIGRMGNTGNAHGIHLHFEIRTANDTRVNPTTYLNQAEPVKQEVKETPVTKAPEQKTEETAPNTKEIQKKEVATETIPKTNIPETKKPAENIQKSTNSVETKNEESTTINTADLDSNNSEVLSNPNYKHGSIVDGLKGIHVDSSYDHREDIAHENGIADYHGTYNQNVYLLSLLKQGKLKNA